MVHWQSASARRFWASLALHTTCDRSWCTGSASCVLAKHKNMYIFTYKSHMWHQTSTRTMQQAHRYTNAYIQATLLTVAAYALHCHSVSAAERCWLKPFPTALSTHSKVSVWDNMLLATRRGCNVAVTNFPPDVLAGRPRARQNTSAKPNFRRRRLGTATLQRLPALSHTHFSKRFPKIQEHHTQFVCESGESHTLFECVGNAVRGTWRNVLTSKLRGHSETIVQKSRNRRRISGGGVLAPNCHSFPRSL